MMRLLWQQSAVIILLCSVAAYAANDDRYRPYPVLLVHGFNSTPGATFGAFTTKDNAGKEDARDVLMLSTRMIGQFAPHDDDHKNSAFETDHLAYKLVTILDDDGNMANASSHELDDYYTNYDEVAVEPTRFYPHEEDLSYSDLNHTYVELYCSYWSYESDDGAGTGAQRGSELVKYGHFVGGIKDGGEECSGTGYGANAYQICYDGQTQLLRIRIIQMLNEYYGDFKWVGDPSCRIKIVCHSNGGLITTNLLKNEETDGWYHDGLNMKRQRWQDFKSPDPASPNKYVIDGYGFRLRARSGGNETA